MTSPRLISTGVLVGLLALFAPTSAHAASEYRDAELATLTVIDAETDETYLRVGDDVSDTDRVEPATAPALAVGSRLTVTYELAADESLDGSSGEYEVIVEPGTIELAAPELDDPSRGSYELIVPDGLEAGVDYIASLRSTVSEPSAEDDVVIWTFAFQIDDGSGSAVVPYSECLTPIPSPVPTDGPSPSSTPAPGEPVPMPIPTQSGRPTPSASPSADPCAGPEAYYREVSPIPGIVFGSLVGAGVLVAIGAQIIRRHRFGVALRRLAERP